MVGCGLACPGGGGAGVSGCEFRGSGWGWDRRCQDPGGGPGRPIPYGGGVATRNTGPYIYMYICTHSSLPQKEAYFPLLGRYLEGEHLIGCGQLDG